MNEKLAQAIESIKAGKKAEGGRALAEIVKTNPDDELAWQWLAACVVPEAQKRHCLGQVLRINPLNDQAKKMLEALDFQPTFETEVSTPPEKKNKGPRTLYIVTFLLCTPLWAILMLTDKKQGPGIKTGAVIYLTFFIIIWINILFPGLLN